MLLNRLQDGPETASEPDGTPDKAFDQAHVSQQFSEPAAPKKSKAPMIASIAAIVLIGAGYVATSSNSEKAQPAAMPTTAVSAPATTPAVPPTGTPATPTAKSQPSTPGAALGAVGASDAGLSALSDGGKAKPTDTKASDAGAKKAPKASKKKKRKRARKKKRRSGPRVR
jgi:hypothetical protein